MLADNDEPTGRLIVYLVGPLKEGRPGCRDNAVSRQLKHCRRCRRRRCSRARKRELKQNKLVLEPISALLNLRPRAAPTETLGVRAKLLQDGGE